jgi:hypothetical protein
MPDHRNLTSTCKLRVAAPELQLDHNLILNFPLPFDAQALMQTASARDTGPIYRFTSVARDVTENTSTS